MPNHPDQYRWLTKVSKEIWELAWGYAMASETITKDVERARTLDVNKLTESEFLHQCAWAIFGGGFRIRVLERIFPRLTEAYLDFNPKQIVQHAELVEKNALRAFGNHRKVNAVVTIAETINSQGWPQIHSKLLELADWDTHNDPWVSQALVDYLDGFRGVGPVLASYICKNIGIASIKPDIWMLSLAQWLGFSRDVSGVWDMAREFVVLSGETVNVIDTVLWNWARDRQDVAKPNE